MLQSGPHTCVMVWLFCFGAAVLHNSSHRALDITAECNEDHAQSTIGHMSCCQVARLRIIRIF